MTIELLALILAMFAAAVSIATLWWQDRLARDLAATDRGVEDDYADFAMEIATLRRELEDAGVLDPDPEGDLDVPTVADHPDPTAVTEPIERTTND